MARQIAHVLLDKEAMPDAVAVAEALRARHPGVAIDAKAPPILTCNGDAIVIMSIGAPLPREKWDLPCQRAKRMWPEAEAVVERHGAHLLVTTQVDTSDKVHSARSMTAVVGALIAAVPGCRAVLWQSLVVHPADRWLDMSRQSFAPSSSPYFLWVSIHAVDESAVRSAITFGLQPFFGREIELETTSTSAAAVIATTAGLVAYLLDHGAVVGDGQTIGAEGGPRLKVRHLMSRRVEGLPVLYVTPLDAAAKEIPGNDGERADIPAQQGHFVMGNDRDASGDAPPSSTEPAHRDLSPPDSRDTLRQVLKMVLANSGPRWSDMKRAVKVRLAVAAAGIVIGLVLAFVGELFPETFYGGRIPDHGERLPDNAAAQSQFFRSRGVGHLLKREYAQAIQDFDQAIGLAPNDALAFDVRGIAYDDMGDHDRAISDFDEAVRLEPDLVEAWDSLGIAWAAKGENDRAIGYFNEALRRKPDLAEAFNGRGTAYGQKGDADRALQDFNEAIRLKPDLSEALFNRAGLYAGRGEGDLAIRDYSEAVRAKPDNAEAWEGRGVVYSSQGDFDRAIADFDEALRIKPDLTAALDARGNAYSDKGDYERALSDFNEAIRLRPDDTVAFNSRGVVYGRRGDLDRALQEFNEAVRLKPDFALALVNRGKIHGSKGEHDLAILDFGRARRADPSNPEYPNESCWERARAGDLEAALKDCNEALRLRPGDANTLDSRGFAYLKMENAEAAIADYDAALETDPKMASALYGRGLAKHIRGDVAGAGADIAAARLIDPKIVEKFRSYGIRGPAEAGDPQP